MANIDTDTLLARVRAIVEDGAGSLRTITADTFRGHLYETLGVDAKAVRALVKPRAEARIVNLERHPGTTFEMGSFQLYSVELEVLMVRSGHFTHALKDTERDDLKALAARDGDVLRQALGWPGNVTGAGVVSDMLRYESSEVGDIELDDEETGTRIETVHRFVGILNVATAIV